MNTTLCHCKGYDGGPGPQSLRVHTPQVMSHGVNIIGNHQKAVSVNWGGPLCNKSPTGVYFGPPIFGNHHMGVSQIRGPNMDPKIVRLLL